MQDRDVASFIFELGQLKRIRHEGWTLCGVEQPDTVAAHTCRAAQIAYILAHMEGYEKPDEVCAMIVFHDVGETRIGDVHKLARRYVEKDENRAVSEQTEKLGEMGKDIYNFWLRKVEGTTVAGTIARDADLLEMAFTGKEYLERSYPAAQDLLNNIERALKTESAKRLLVELQQMDSTSWWHGLKKLRQ